jgi:hypothetical protein
MQAIHPIRHNAAGQSLCRWCSQLTRHYTLFICDARIHTGMCLAEEREQFDRKFLSDCGIAGDAPARGVVTVEIVMQGAVVRQARELHAMRNRQPLMGDERRGQGAGEIDLGEIS